MGIDYFQTRFIFQRALALIYLFAFLIAANQFRGLCGENGLAPVRLFVKRVPFWESPSLFWFYQADWFLGLMAWLGVVLSVVALTGFSDFFSQWISMLVWFLLWGIYLSFCNVGQVFYGFGWEMLLLETGFLTIFLGATRTTPPILLIWLLRWLLFRLMFGAGMIKIRGDSCWRDLTCLEYHHETQPLPGPLSWYFHHFSPVVLRLGVAFNHFVELIVPFGYFGPTRVRHIAGVLTVVFQTTLILSGNFSWLNCITLVIALACFNDQFWTMLWGAALGVPAIATLAGLPGPLILALSLGIVLLSLKPALNLVSSSQLMNASFEPFHVVNTYGAFGSVTRERSELIIEGTSDDELTATTQWRPYEFKAKPGRLDRMPPQVTPYHYKIDWQMWFAAMSPYYQHPWIVNLVSKLLQNQKEVVGLLGDNPFPDRPPTHIRIVSYIYHFTNWGEKGWWKRENTGIYLPPLSLKDEAFRRVLEENEWLPTSQD